MPFVPFMSSVLAAYRADRLIAEINDLPVAITGEMRDQVLAFCAPLRVDHEGQIDKSGIAPRPFWRAAS